MNLLSHPDDLQPFFQALFLLLSATLRERYIIGSLKNLAHIRKLSCVLFFSSIHVLHCLLAARQTSGRQTLLCLRIAYAVFFEERSLPALQSVLHIVLPGDSVW
jgi:hypothetical protein